jgi:hypothetical protein
MNDILRDVLHKFVIVNLDDVSVSTRTMEGHLEHMRLVLQRFKEEGLKLHLKKCFVGLQDMEYPGYTLSARTISVLTNKVEAVDYKPMPIRKRRIAVSYISASSKPHSSITLATLRHH